MDEKAYCWTCGWSGTENECNDPEDLWERLAPGDEFPVGECPACGFLAYINPLED